MEVLGGVWGSTIREMAVEMSRMAIAMDSASFCSGVIWQNRVGVKALLACCQTEDLQKNFYTNWELELFGVQSSLWEFFYSFMLSLSAGWFAPNWVEERHRILRNRLIQAKQANDCGDDLRAEAALRQILPPI